MNFGFNLERVIESHTSIVVRHQQDYHLSDVTYVSSVILIRLRKRKVYNIKHYISQRKCHNYQSSESLFITYCHIDS